MKKTRLEAFSDGVIAIITIIVLEMKVSHGTDLAALWFIPERRVEKEFAA